jgi:hypothetical protein
MTETPAIMPDGVRGGGGPRANDALTGTRVSFLKRPQQRSAPIPLALTPK